MSKKFKSAMDKIVVSDELKTRIMNAAEKKIDGKKTKNSKLFFLRYAAGYAACIAAFAAVMWVVNNSRLTYVPQPSPNVGTLNTPIPGETPQQPAAKPSPSANTNAAAGETPKPVISERTPQANTNAEPQGREQNTETPPAASVGTPRPEAPASAMPTEVPIPTDAPSLPPSGSGQPEMSVSPADTEGPVMSGYYEYEGDLADIRKEVGYDFKIPSYMPKEYKIESASLLFGELIQIVYKGENDTVFYRTERAEEDISGDYNIYEITENAGEGITLKGNEGKYYLGTIIGKESCSVSSSEGMSRETILKIMESIDDFNEE